MHKNLISVIIPSYNASNYIKYTISSVLNQTYKYFEIIIVDDCSTDNTVEEIKKIIFSDKRIRFFQLKKNLGVSYCRNFAISKAKGEYYCFLDSDDIWDKNKLELQLNFMKKNNYLFSFTSYRLIDFNNSIIKNKISVPKKINYNRLLKENSIACLTVMINRKLFKKDLFENAHHEDYIAWLSILKEERYAYGLNTTLASYRKTKNSISANKFKSSMWVWNIYRNIEGLSLFKSFYSFIHYSVRGFLKHYF